MKKAFTNYCVTPKYSPSHDTITCLSYPLTLHPRATIQIYQNRGCTPIKASCRQCKAQTTISLTQQKLFLTAERLFLKSTDKETDIERNQTNTWAVNYEVGIYEPFVEHNTGFKSKKTLDNMFYPFADEFELELVVKLLQRVGEGLSEASLNLYLKILKGIDEIVKVIPPAPVVPPPHASIETPKESGSYVSPAPPASTPLRPSFQYPSVTSGPSSPLAPPGQLPLLCPPLNQLPSVSHILNRKPPLRSFNDLRELFELFDKIERGSYAAARLMEGYADAIVNEACIDCWAQHNIVDDDAGDDTGFVDPFPFSPPLHGQLVNPVLFVGPVNVQQQCKRLGPQEGMGANLRQPFGEIENNIGSGFKRSRESDGKEEDELERRWRERARKREAIKDGAKIVEPMIKRKWGEGENQEGEFIVID